MNLINRFFHPAHSSYAYQPLNKQDGITEHVSATPHRKNPYNEAAPLAACRTGNLEWLDEQLAHDPAIVHLDYQSGRTDLKVPLLYIASQNGHVELVRQLIKKGADASRCLKDGTTPLFVAAQNGQFEIVRQLIKQGVDVNGSRNDHATPLLIAASNGHTEIVRLLLKEGADVNLSRKDGTTPLFFTAQNGHRDTVLCLLDAGADPATKSQFLTSPKDVARNIAHDELIVGMIETALKQRSMLTERYNPYNESAPIAACRTGNLKWLNEELARDPNIVFRRYKSKKSGRLIPLLVIACGYGHHNIVHQLIKHGANVNFADNNGLTPLTNAVSWSHLEIVDCLIEQGADVNYVNKKGETPLFNAASRGHSESVDRLIEHGADVNLATQNNATPLLIAAQNGHRTIVDHLLKAGADPSIKCKTFGLLSKSPKAAAIFHAHDKKMVTMINKALKQRTVNRTSSEECLLFGNDDSKICYSSFNSK